MTIYFLSGLGADERAFAYLDLPGIERVYLNWMPPLPKETMQQYAQRMADRITTPNPIIIGLSFGGMMAMEIAKLIPVKQLVLISSAKTKHELPPYFRFCRYLPLHRLLPLDSIGVQPQIMRFFFGARTPNQQEMLRQIIQNSVKGFNQWAIHQVVNWKNQTIAAPVFHVHGNADNLLPLRYVKADAVIDGGDHFMVGTKAKQLSSMLMKLIKEF
jgi:pimeloyl-ACP methyl ester carboxylesterase